MNPNYNQQQQQPQQPSQQYYYNYQQHTPGPPQPSWQAPVPQSPGGWHDPRFQSIPPPSQSPQYNQPSFQPVPSHHSPYPPPPPPPPSQTASFTPGTVSQPPLRPQEHYHGAGTAQYDTSQWGVKYNQTAQNQYQPDATHTLQPEPRPALPPRPGSSLSQNSSLSSHQYAPSVSSFAPSTTQYPTQGSWGISSGYGQEHKPPTPPPRPAAYAASPQQGSLGPLQDPYSHHTPTHHYDPTPQQQPSWQQPQQGHSSVSTHASWSQAQHTFDGPVSPIQDDSRRESLAGRPVNQYIDYEPPSQDVQLPSQPSRSSTKVSSPKPTGVTSTSAFSGPFDWQHYNPSPPNDENETPINSQPQAFTASPLQTTYSIKRKSVERPRPTAQGASQQPSIQPLHEEVNQPPQRNPAIDQTHHQELETPPSVYGPAPGSRVTERQDSNHSDVSSVGAIERNDTIDNIIQAWSTPITTDTPVQNPLPPTQPELNKKQAVLPPKIEMLDREVQTDFKPQVETRVETKIETKIVEKDPYADIQNQYQATLKRFAEMLRQEAAAGSDEEKFKVFQGFVIRELRLRSVLYGVEAQTQDPAPRIEHSQQKESAQVPPVQAPTPNRSIEQPSSQPESPSQQRPKLEVRTPTTPESKNDSFVMVEPNGIEDEYSPGGRPRISSLKTRQGHPVDTAWRANAANKPPSPTAKALQPEPVSPSINAPMTLDDYVMPDRPSPSADAPIVVDSDNFNETTGTELTGPLNFQPARPLYQPFRYSEGATEPVPTVHIQGPPAESFTALRQTQAAESGRTLVHDAPPVAAIPAPDRGSSKTPSGGRREHEEAFIGLIRAKSQAIRTTANSTPRPESPAILRAGTPMNRSTPSPSPAPVSPLIKSVQSLRPIIPKSLPPQPGPKTAPHPKLEPVQSAMYKVIDDFSFIHARVLTWDKSNRQIRAKQDAERHARQSQNEERIDELFNDNEIGYADIGELEKDFKLEEAGRKYKEDQEELESFTKGVFEIVVEKLESEIRELTKLQTNAIDMLDLESTSGAKQVQASQNSGGLAPNPPISSIMQLLLQIHEKREVRYLKIAEASFERERRRKRLELSVLYTNNDKGGIKKLEAEFAKAEKIQILEEMRKKAERANRLLDSFDRAIVKGLAENQGVMDDVLARLQLIRDLFLGSEENLPQGQAKDDLLYGDDSIKDLMDRTSALIGFIHNDSQSLVRLLDKADSLSNNADFEMYMSEAKLADASPEQYQKLKAEKEAEDRNVDAELTSRLNGMAHVPTEILGLVKEVRDRVGGDAGHQERINKALEAAKLRNEATSG